MEKELSFNTTNEAKQFKKPKIDSGEYEFRIADIKPSADKSKNYFILDIVGAVFEDEPVSLVWSAPSNDEYSPGTNVGKLFLSVGLELGGNVKASSLIGLSGRCVVTEYAQSVPGKGTVVSSSVGDLIIPEQKIVEPTETDTEDAGVDPDGNL